MSKIDDVLAVMAQQGGKAAPSLDSIRFGVCTRPDGGDFVLGEVYLVRDESPEEREVGMGREFGGEWRRPWKWSGAVEVFDTLDEAAARSREVRGE